VVLLLLVEPLETMVVAAVKEEGDVVVLAQEH
jgi:hypothetical protein